MRIGAISAMLSISRFCVGKGLVDPGEVETVPDQIKKIACYVVAASSAFACIANSTLLMDRDFPKLTTK